MKFPKKKLTECISLSTTGVELEGSKDLRFWNYYNALKGSNAAKNIDYIEKYFKQKLRKIKFLTKNSVEAYLYLTLEWS